MGYFTGESERTNISLETAFLLVRKGFINREDLEKQKACLGRSGAGFAQLAEAATLQPPLPSTGIEQAKQT